MQFTEVLIALLRQDARRLIQQVMEIELEVFMEAFHGRLLENGRAGVVRNGFHPERIMQTGIGPVTVRVPKVRVRDGKPVTFRSVLVPPYVRKTRTLSTALPWIYLQGIARGEMTFALEELVGPEVKDLSAGTVSRLKQIWAEECRRWREVRLDKDCWVYLWAYGVYNGLKAADTKLCTLVIIGVNTRGIKSFLAIEDGASESTQSWKEMLIKLKARGMHAPKLAISDCSTGFRVALKEIFAETFHHHHHPHKTMNGFNGRRSALT